jgi:hypothetical protein
VTAPSDAGRRRRPLLYPVGLAIAFVLLMLDATGISAFAALRALLVVGLVTLALSTAMTWLLGDRHPAAVVTLLVLLAVLVLQNSLLVVMVVATAILLVLATVLARSRPLQIPWNVVSRGFTALCVVVLLAIGIRSVQDGRLVGVVDDLFLEGPIRPHAVRTASPDAAHPDVYMLMLDGYPRSDKLRAEFAIDNEPFLGALERDDFVVSTHSRSNYVQTRQTLISLFNGAHVDTAVPPNPTKADIRTAINAGRALEPFTNAGYETVAISSGFEEIAPRRFDRFIDTGQLNEFERVLVQSTVQPALNTLWPTFLADDHAARVRASLTRALALTTESGPPRLAFIHIASPHAPVVLAPDGTTLPNVNDFDFLDDRDQYAGLGREEYSRRLEGQIDYLNDQVLRALDGIDRSGRPAIVVVFSDHGSGIRFAEDDPASDYDLRTANLLAVRGFGPPDDRTTLVNLLPTIAGELFGTPYTPQPDDIRILSADFATFVAYARPD